MGSEATEKQKRQREKSRAWYQAHKAQHAAKVKARRLANPEEAKHWHRARLYGVTKEIFENTVAKQNGLCAICLRIPKKWYVDHCHATGKFRALLCCSCNTALGLLGDSMTTVQSALDYLRHFDFTDE